MKPFVFAGLALAAALTLGCEEEGDRPDGAYLLASDEGSLQNPCLSYEGDRAVATRYRDGYGEGPADLVLVDLGDFAVTDLLADGGRHVNHTGHCWSEAQDAIVFSSDAEDDRWELYRIDPDGGAVERITVREGLDATEATWSDTGQFIVFTSRPAGDPDAAGTTTVIGADGEGETPLTPEGADDRHPAASPAGNLVVAESWEGGTSRLVMMNLTGTFRDDLTDGDAADREPSWAWTGQSVTFRSVRDGQGAGTDIYTLKIEGCEITRLTEDESFDRKPSFTDGNTHILYESSSASDGHAELWYYPYSGS